MTTTDGLLIINEWLNAFHDAVPRHGHACPSRAGSYRCRSGGKGHALSALDQQTVSEAKEELGHEGNHN
jgi:hypothetical protein